ncbi:MAG: lipoyl synthase [Candidatus Saganbacteria bacterium]|nr:lipoyl synthase [Candidatus Saganbacteria bacterium]
MVLPDFLIKRIPKQEHIKKVRALIDDCEIHTVCESAKCPNIGECFKKKSLTFMILGNICTRHCAFCGVKKGEPLLLDQNEPKRISEATMRLGLNYVVITSVTRDDLEDGGASQFVRVITELKRINPSIKIEVLIPDFMGNEEALRNILKANPYVLNHNVETIPRLYPLMRAEANYGRSLTLLSQAKAINRQVYTKSGFMVGLGETKEEIVSLLADLRGAGCDLVTIGQYLPPSKKHPKAVRYVEPDEFSEYKRIGENLGFKRVFSGPFVRSSFNASELASN